MFVSVSPRRFVVFGRWRLSFFQICGALSQQMLTLYNLAHSVSCQAPVLTVCSFRAQLITVTLSTGHLRVDSEVDIKVDSEVDIEVCLGTPTVPPLIKAATLNFR